jgi:hypothetical protein
MPRSLLSLAALVLLFSGPALAESTVNIIYPPHAPAVDLSDEEPDEDIQEDAAEYTVIERSQSPRRAIAKRALFQNWTGFIYQYDGARYPF